MNTPTIFARYSEGNQYVRYRITPGKKPASAAPSRNRSTRKLVGPPINAKAADTTPQEIMIRAIHRLAPNRCSPRLLGTSSKKYPMKKIPAPRP